MLPTPPEAPSTSTRSSAVTLACSVAVRQAVTPATPMAAASARSTPAGTSVTAELGATTREDQAPSRAVPRPAALDDHGPAVVGPAAGAFHPDGAGQRPVGGHPALRRVAVDGVDAGEGHLDDDLVVARGRDVDLLHHEGLAVGVQAGRPGPARECPQSVVMAPTS